MRNKLAIFYYRSHCKCQSQNKSINILYRTTEISTELVWMIAYAKEKTQRNFAIRTAARFPFCIARFNNKKWKKTLKTRLNIHAKTFF